MEPTLVEIVRTTEVAASGARSMQITRIDEPRHVPAVADRQQTQRKPCRHRAHHHRIMRQAGAKAADIKGARDDRDARLAWRSLKKAFRARHCGKFLWEVPQRDETEAG